MNFKYFHIALVVWIFAVVPMGFSESFPNRPTEWEMEGLVVSGTQCARGVNERCYATQTSTNSTYSVSPPFTNGTGLYLDQSTMGTMASKIRSLVPYYVDPDTVYDGTTNISMLSVTSLWVELDIGDHTNQFTQIFASGTNSAVYGDSPWRIYWENLDERYYVLNVLQKRLLGSYAGTSFPEVVQTATIWGEGTSAAGGYCSVWYSYGGNNLGPADETAYDIEIDTRAWGGSGGADYISLGQGGGWQIGLPNNVMSLILDTDFGTNIASFSASVGLDANPNVIKIYNCWAGTTTPEYENLNASYDYSNVEVSADLPREDQASACFGFYGVIIFPFQYCK